MDKDFEEYNLFLDAMRQEICGKIRKFRILGVTSVK